MSAKKIEKTSEIVRYNKDLSELPLRNFSPAELDIFMTLCAECKDKGVEEITIPFTRLKELANYKKTNRITRTQEEIKADLDPNSKLAPQSFVGALKLTNKKLLNLNLELHSEDNPGVSVQFNLFKTFITDERNKTLTVKVNEDFSFILNELTSEFTQFELADFVALHSGYAKGAYRQMKRYKDTGFWYVDIEKFRRILDIPASYKSRDIDTRVIAPIMTELSPIFEKLEIEKQYGMTSGRGRTSVTAYKFTWVPVKALKGSKASETKALEATSKGIICPYCGDELLEKEINGSNCWCHPANFVSNKKKGTNKCIKIFNSMDEIRKAAEDLTMPEDLSPEEEAKRQENLKKIYDIVGDSFSAEKKEPEPSRRNKTIKEIRNELIKEIPDLDEMISLCVLDKSDNDTVRLNKDLKKLKKAIKDAGYPEEYAELLI